MRGIDGEWQRVHVREMSERRFIRPNLKMKDRLKVYVCGMGNSIEVNVDVYRL